jgi:hypothetical protein
LSFDVTVSVTTIRILPSTFSYSMIEPKPQRLDRLSRRT